METRNEKFRRLAAARMTRIYQTMNLIANLARPQYAYTQEDVAELFEAYQQAGNEAHTYFDGPTRFNEMSVAFTFTNTSTVAASDTDAHEKFLRLAENRFGRVLRDLRLIVNLSDKSNYMATADEIDELFAGYSAKGKTVAARFSPLSDEFRFTSKA